MEDADQFGGLPFEAVFRHDLSRVEGIETTLDRRRRHLLRIGLRRGGWRLDALVLIDGGGPNRKQRYQDDGRRHHPAALPRRAARRRLIRARIGVAVS